MTDLCAVDAAALKSALAVLHGESIEVVYSQPLPGYFVLTVGDTSIPTSQPKGKYKERRYEVSLERLRAAVDMLPDGLVTVADEDGALVIGGERVDDEDTQPVEATAEPKSAPVPPAYLPLTLPHVEPTTQTFRILRAALALSTAEYGTAQVAIVTGGYAIRLADRLAYGVNITDPACTFVSLHVLTRSRWVVVETRKLPKLKGAELLNLFVMGDSLTGGQYNG